MPPQAEQMVKKSEFISEQGTIEREMLIAYCPLLIVTKLIHTVKSPPDFVLLPCINANQL